MYNPYLPFAKFIRFQIVRLLKEINVNDTDSFCQPNIVLSDYLPDSTGMFTDIKNQICNKEKTELYKELPPLLFASQVSISSSSNNVLITEG